VLGTFINLVLQIFSGALGGHLVEAVGSKNLSKLEKTLVGAVGGVIGGQTLGLFIPLLSNAAESPSTAAAISQVITGGVVGAAFTAILRALKNKSSA
jgi:hypothetical protein